MKIELSPRSVAYAEQLVAEGRAVCIEEAIETALASFSAQDTNLASFLEAQDAAWRDELRTKVAEADEDIAAGRVRRLDATFFDELRTRIREKANNTSRLA